MKKTLGFIGLFLIMQTHHVFAGGDHHGHGHGKKIKKNKLSYSYQGNSDFKYDQAYQLVLNLSDVDSTDLKKPKKPGTRMSSEEKDLLWKQLSEDLPPATHFKIIEAEYADNGLAYVVVKTEESTSETVFDSVAGDLILDHRVKHEIRHPAPLVTPIPKLFEDTEKWTKETGYKASLKYLNDNNLPAMRVFIICHELIKDGDVNFEKYTEIFNEVGILIDAKKMTLLPNGTRGLYKLVTPEILGLLYEEDAVANFMPKYE